MQNTDTELDQGGANAITAATLRGHVDNAAIHFEIDDVTPATDKAYSSSFIQQELDDLAASFDSVCFSLLQLNPIRAIMTNNNFDLYFMIILFFGFYYFLSTSVLACQLFPAVPFKF